MSYVPAEEYFSLALGEEKVNNGYILMELSAKEDELGSWCDENLSQAYEVYEDWFGVVHLWTADETDSTGAKLRWL